MLTTCNCIQIATFSDIILRDWELFASVDDSDIVFVCQWVAQFRIFKNFKCPLGNCCCKTIKENIFHVKKLMKLSWLMNSGSIYGWHLTVSRLITTSICNYNRLQNRYGTTKVRALNLHPDAWSDFRANLFLLRAREKGAEDWDEKCDHKFKFSPRRVWVTCKSMSKLQMGRSFCTNLELKSFCFRQLFKFQVLWD